jgi:hypothetical protein
MANTEMRLRSGTVDSCDFVPETRNYLFLLLTVVIQGLSAETRSCYAPVFQIQNYG